MRNVFMTRMKCERIRRGWSQQILAVRTSIGVADISRIENGKLQPYPIQAQKISTVLGISLDELQQPAKLEVVNV
jgi:ribosome-binding protein aMBF1 (putative translation factor)